MRIEKNISRKAIRRHSPKSATNSEPRSKDAETLRQNHRVRMVSKYSTDNGIAESFADDSQINAETTTISGAQRLKPGTSGRPYSANKFPDQSSFAGLPFLGSKKRDFRSIKIKLRKLFYGVEQLLMFRSCVPFSSISKIWLCACRHWAIILVLADWKSCSFLDFIDGSEVGLEKRVQSQPKPKRKLQPTKSLIPKQKNRLLTLGNGIGKSNLRPLPTTKRRPLIG